MKSDRGNKQWLFECIYQMPDVSDDVEHELFDWGVAEVLGRLVIVLGFENVLHDEDDVFDELGVGLVDDNLSASIEELFNNDFDLFEEDWVKRGRHFVADQLLDVLLDLRAEFFVRTNEKSQKLTQELRHRTVLNVLASSVRQNPWVKPRNQENIFSIINNILSQ